MLTADLMDDLSDPLVPDYSPLPPSSLVGVIGQPPPASPHPISRLSAFNEPSSQFSASRPKTPPPNKLYNFDNLDHFDLSSLVAHTRVEKSVGVIGEGLGALGLNHLSSMGLRTDAPDYVPRVPIAPQPPSTTRTSQTTQSPSNHTKLVGNGTFGHRRMDSEPWPARPAPGAGMRISTRSPEKEWGGRGLVGVGSIDTEHPKSAPPLPLFQPFSDPKPPILPPPGFAPHPTHTQKPKVPHVQSGNNVDQITNHLSALTSLVENMTKDMEEVGKIRKEVDMWRTEWGNVEKERKRLETILEQSESSEKGGSFSAILLDGDELIFQDELLREGYQGGQQAARTLSSSLLALSVPIGYNGQRDQHETDQSPGEGSRLSVQVFLNKHGLGNALVKAGVIHSVGVFDSFWQGFQALQGLITVIDIGTTKHAASTKIHEHLKLHVQSKTCQTVLLGSKPESMQAMTNNFSDEQSCKVVFLVQPTDSSSPTQLKQTHSIPNLFRTSKPVSIPTSAQSFSAVLQSSAPATPTSNPNVIKKLPNTGTGGWTGASQSSEDSPPVMNIELGANAVSPTNGKGKDTANANANANGSKKKRDKKKDKKEKVIPTKSLDEPWRPLPAEDDDGWVQAHPKRQGGKRNKENGKGKIKVSSVRNLKPRPCHTFYLSPWGCRSGEECDYSHDYELTDAQLDELAKLAKEIICPYVKNNRCHFTDEECVYGHKCPRGAGCSFGESCRFTVLENAHGEND